MRRVFLVLLTLTATATFAQRNASGILEKKGDQEFFYFNYLQSARIYQEAYLRDTSNTLLKVKIADSYRLANQPDRAKAWYEKALDNPGNTFAPVHKLNYSKVLLALGLHEQAKKWLLAYQEQNGPD